MIRVIGIKITDRIKESGLVQKVLSSHSQIISTRLGFHELSTELCSREGLMVIHLAGEPVECDDLIKSLNRIDGILVREMAFSHGISDAPWECTGETLLGLVVPQRNGIGLSVQQKLSSYGCVIRTRLGVNEVYFGEPAGLIILELAGDCEQFVSLEKSLREIEEIAVGRICFPS